MKVDNQNRITIPMGMRKMNPNGGEVNVYLLGDWETNSEKVHVLISAQEHEEYAYIGKRTLDPKGRMSITLVFDFICDRDSKPQDYDVLIYMQNGEVYLLCKRQR